VAGTTARKGSNIRDRPHRVATIMMYPDTLTTISKEQLEGLVTELATIPPAGEDKQSNATGQVKPNFARKENASKIPQFDPKEYAEDHGLEVIEVKEAKFGTLAILKNCPFNDEHGENGEVFIGRHKSGARMFKCQHDSCSDNGWGELKALLGDESSILTFDDVTNKIGEGDDIKWIFSPERASKAVIANILLAMTENGNDVYYYTEDGIWKNQAVELAIDPALCEAAGDMIDARALKETVRRVKSSLLARPVKFNPKPYLFPTLDGVVDLETGEFRELRPDDYMTFRYNAAWNCPGADYELYLWFLCSSLEDPRDVITLIDAKTSIGIRKAMGDIFLLFGGGNNGKLVFEDTVKSMYTKSRGAFTDLKEIKESRFAQGFVDGKDYWIVSEIATIKDVMSVLKKRATGDTGSHDRKYSVDPITSDAWEVFIGDANKDKAYDFADNSHGRKRRTVITNFPYKFGFTANLRPEDKGLPSKLTTLESLSGDARIVWARAKTLIETGRTYRRKTIEEQEDEQARRLHSVPNFIDDCLSQYAADAPNKTDLTAADAYAEYEKYCDLYKVTEPFTPAYLGKAICNKFKIESVASNSVRRYPGIYMAKTAQQSFDDKKMRKEETIETSVEEKIKLALDSWAGDNPVLKDVIKKIQDMYEYINDDICKTNPSHITYKEYKLEKLGEEWAKSTVTGVQ
jgi:phage/plasmid-associated DNA primase